MKEEIYELDEQTFKDQLKEMINSITLNFNKTDWQEYIKQDQYGDFKFYDMLDELYKNAFLYSKSMSLYIHNKIIEIESFINQYDTTITFNNEPTLLLLQRLCTNGERRFNEINTLTSNGYPEGSFILTRSLYEINALSHFITKYREEAAIELLSYNKNDYKWMKKMSSFKKCNMRDLNINFMIQKSGLNYDKWTESYKYQNKLIHSNIWNITNSMYDFEKKGPRIVGPTNHGLAYAAEHSSKHFASICKCYVNEVFVYATKLEITDSEIKDLDMMISEILLNIDLFVKQIESEYHEIQIAIENNPNFNQ